MDDDSENVYLAEALKKAGPEGSRSLRARAEEIHAAHTLYQKWQETNVAMSPVNHVRENAAKEILKRGHTTFDEILRISYGEWPVKGLDIVGQNLQLIALKTIDGEASAAPLARPMSARMQEILNSPYGLSHNTTYERTLSFNLHKLSMLPFIMGGGGILHSALIHEGTHTVQHDHTSRLVDTFGRVKNVTSGVPVSRVLASDEIATPYFAPEEGFDIALHGGIRSHLKAGREIQARLAQIIPDGYQKWGVMPANKEELFVALKDIGLHVPDEVIAEYEGSPTLMQNNKTFSGSADASPMIVHDLNLIIDVLPADRKVAFWQQAMPALYADMIEMYGDRQGRARFGLGENPRLALRQNQMALLQLVAQGPWQDVPGSDGARAKQINYGQLSKDQQAQFREAFSVANIRPVDPQYHWPPPDDFEDSSEELWILQGAELDKLEKLQVHYGTYARPEARKLSAELI